MFYIFTLSNLIVVESFQYNGRIYQVNHHESTGWRGSVTRIVDRPFDCWRDRWLWFDVDIGMKLPQGDRASTCFCVYQMMMQPKLLDTVALLTQISQQRLTLVEVDSPVVDGCHQD